MTTAILTMIRQQLRKRWVRGSACLGLMLVGYVASAGHVTGLAFSPFVNKTLPSDHQLQRGVLRFYQPLFIVAGLDYCPKLVPSFISFSMGMQKRAVAVELNQMARAAKNEGRLERARHLAMFSAKLAVQYDIFDDRPDLIIAELKHFYTHQASPQPVVMTSNPIVVRWNELTCEEWRFFAGQILSTPGITYEPPDDSERLSPQFDDDGGDCGEMVCLPPAVTCCSELSTAEGLDKTGDLVFRSTGPAVLPASAEGSGSTPPSSEECPTPWAGRQFFEDRPDLILLDSDSVRSTVDKTLQPFSVSIVDIRDEQDFPNASPSAQDQASVYTFRVAFPDLLLHESHIVQLQCSADLSDENEKDRIFAALADRIVCQKEFPKRDNQSEVMNLILGFNR